METASAVSLGILIGAGIISLILLVIKITKWIYDVSGRLQTNEKLVEDLCNNERNAEKTRMKIRAELAGAKEGAEKNASAVVDILSSLNERVSNLESAVVSGEEYTESTIIGERKNG